MPVLTSGQVAAEFQMADKDPALHAQRIVFESACSDARSHEVNASGGWLANADGRGLTTQYSHEVIPGGERTCTGGWAVSITATGMAVEKQLQFREHIKKYCRPWDSKFEFTMPGKLTLYRD
jgi:hypothetical protein